MKGKCDLLAVTNYECAGWNQWRMGTARCRQRGVEKEAGGWQARLQLLCGSLTNHGMWLPRLRYFTLVLAEV